MSVGSLCLAIAPLKMGANQFFPFEFIDFVYFVSSVYKLSFQTSLIGSFSMLFFLQRSTIFAKTIARVFET
jgi:hypothetical protein